MEKTNKKKKKKRVIKGPALRIIVVLELLGLVLLVILASQLISLNSDKDVIYADSQYVDDISYTDGRLTVNNVDVSIPFNEKTTYNISYGWGKNDKKYPTIPQSVTASYDTKKDESKFDICLYRDSLTDTKDIPSGKKTSNWFADWKTIEDESSKQAPKDSGNIKGFMISTTGNSSDSPYYSDSFYFAVRTDEGISVYVLEGILYDKKYQKEFNKVLESAITSIHIASKERAS